jgi:hypothetical protein
VIKKKCITKKTYHYIKSWTSYPINSLFFDQPAAHHNPQRNPYPSEQFTTSNLVLYEDHNPTMMKIDSNILTNLKNSKYHPIDFTLNGIKKTSHDISQFTSLFNNIFGNFLGLTSSTETLSSIEQTRYEDINQLKISSINSLATKNDGFYYVGNGFFFSPYQSDLITQISKTFFGYLEGSLFDWQLGDLISSCTPGDIRVKYEIQDPDTISVLGIINEKSVLANNNHDNIQQQQNEKLYISNYESKNIDKYKLGISVGGSMSASKMMDDVIYDNWYNLFLTRVLLLPWSFVISKIIFSFFGIELRNGYTSYHNNNEKKTTTFIISLLGLLGIWTSFVGFCDFITHIDSFISNNNIDFQIENDSNNIHNLNQENEEEEENIYHILSYDELQSLYNRLIILFSFSMISLIYVIKKAARCKKSGFKASWSVLKQLLKIETDSTTCMGSCDSKEIKE